MKIIYVLTMERYGDPESHHYIWGLYSDLAVATVEALEHENMRAGKYEMKIEMAELDGDSIKEVPRQIAIDMAVLKFPDKFDDKKRLKEDDNG